MAIKDNREFLAALEKVGEAVRIEEEVDWDCEAGAIVRRACELGAPVPFFQKVKDYPGHRMAGALLASFRRIAVMMGLDPDIPVRDLLNEWEKRITTPIKPVVVKDAPCQENVVMGKDVDLTMFPAPMIHDGDGGRFTGTWHIVIQKHPDTGVVNWGMYRNMLHNERLIGCLLIPGREGTEIMLKYEARKERMPFAIAIGPPPACAAAGAATMVGEVREPEAAGSIQGEPIELVKCKTVDLEVPAHAEIVLEGHAVLGELVEEGPFGEYTGYRGTPRYPRPVFEIECITWRNNPILTMSNMGIPIDESQTITFALGLGIALKKHLEAARVPITGVWMPPEGAGFIVVVGVRKIYNEIAHQIAHVIASHPMGMVCTTKIIVVDETVDPFNMAEVMHALATKLHPIKGVFSSPRVGNPVCPYLNLQERSTYRGGAVLFDCTWPVEWDPETEKPPMSSFKGIYTEELQKKVLANWRKYGYKVG